ncbi:MAG: hypothetical protein OEY51_06880 [Cyclobacteriaceae bacterium]|nr:hypothetical protein [Cyclobacteriaceae bacterium]
MFSKAATGYSQSLGSIFCGSYMKTLLTIILTFIFFNSNGQSSVSFVFYDACVGKVVELPYKLWNGQTDSTIQISSGQSIQLEPGYYQVQLDIIWNEMYSGLWFDIYFNNEPTEIDTLFLQTPRFFGPTYLHAPPEEFKHYCCDELCNGKIEEIDNNGVTRFKGRFRNGQPIGNLKYYSSNGELTRTEVYVKGQLERIK